MEYEIPESSKRNKGNLKRLDSLFSNFDRLSQKDESSKNFTPIQRNLSSLKEKEDNQSSTYKNVGGLSAIKERHDLENSNSSEIMDKPIRSLRELYTGIKKDMNKRKQIKKKKREEVKDLDSSEESFSTCQEEDYEIDTFQKQILEDKVYKLITHWNDIDYIKNHHEAF